jgi:hypothetical protein
LLLHLGVSVTKQRRRDFVSALRTSFCGRRAALLKPPNAGVAVESALARGGGGRAPGNFTQANLHPVFMRLRDPGDENACSARRRVA